MSASEFELEVLRVGAQKAADMNSRRERIPFAGFDRPQVMRPNPGGGRGLLDGQGSLFALLAELLTDLFAHLLIITSAWIKMQEQVQAEAAIGLSCPEGFKSAMLFLFRTAFLQPGFRSPKLLPAPQVERPLRPALHPGGLRLRLRGGR